MERSVENRQNRRYTIRLSAEVTYAGHTFTAITRDLSAGGVCLESRRVLPEGDPLQVGLFLVVDEIEDAEGPALQVKGRVAWAVPGEDGRPGTMGIRFEGVSPGQVAGLTKFLAMLPQT
jgi:hypothetical protein